MAYPISVIQLDIDFAHPRCKSRCGAGADIGSRCARRAAWSFFRRLSPPIIIAEPKRLPRLIPGPLTEAFSKIAGAATIAVPILEKRCGRWHFQFVRAGERERCRRRGAQDAFVPRSVGARIYSATRRLFAPGNELLNVFDAGDLRVGVALGFDADFPEVFRTLALKGADAILAVLNTVEPDAAFLAAMARRNRVAIAVANRIGFKRIYPAAPEFSAASSPIVQDKRGEFLIRCKGGSAIIGPDGAIAAQPRAHETPPTAQRAHSGSGQDSARPFSR